MVRAFSHFATQENPILICDNSIGLYFILFGICLYVLCGRKETSHWILLTFASAMFTIATTDIIYTYYLIFTKLFIGGLSFTDLRPKYWLYVTNK
jgi:hypothetical protein